MNQKPTPAQGLPRPSIFAAAASLVGRIAAFALIAGAGVVGWLAVEELELAIPSSGNGAPVLAASLPDLGDGLPAARLQSPAPWRQFALTYQDPVALNRFWIDLDSWQVRIESNQQTVTSAVEINGDRSFTRESATAEWLARDVKETRDIASWLMSGIGPFVLTDLVPPNTLGFTTLELEGTSRDERVYEVSVDAATLQEQHPLAHQRWVEATRLVSDTSGVYRIRVREDGYIVRIDGETSSVQWDALEGGVVFFSPFALEAPQTLATAPATTVLGAPVDVPPVPVEEPVADN
jgi:hypothetical protein